MLRFARIPNLAKTYLHWRREGGAIALRISEKISSEQAWKGSGALCRSLGGQNYQFADDITSEANEITKADGFRHRLVG